MADYDNRWFKEEFRPHFDKLVMGPIDRLVVSSDALVGFILMSCAIDYLSGFWSGESTKGKVKVAYTEFINRYFPKDKYDSGGLYDSLRNGLVHSFTIKDGKYSLVHNHPELHLTVDSRGQRILDAGRFRDDLVMAKDAYFLAVEKDPALLQKLVSRLRRDGFLQVGPL